MSNSTPICPSPGVISNPWDSEYLIPGLEASSLARLADFSQHDQLQPTFARVAAAVQACFQLLQLQRHPFDRLDRQAFLGPDADLGFPARILELFRELAEMRSDCSVGLTR